VHALNGVSFTIQAGRSLGIVGESGSGKSTLARLVMALDQPTSGRVRCGRDLHALPREELRKARRDFQMVFQDPYGSLDPRQTVERIVSEPLARRAASAAPNSTSAPPKCWRRWACGPTTWASTRTSSPAASASASPSRGRWSRGRA
jgi:ABC-type glutathione transport system ATPase component